MVQQMQVRGAPSTALRDATDSKAPPAGGTTAKGRRPDLQGMRAVAVLAVFSDHLFDWPSGGFVGVDVFFVLSGFFISGLLIRDRTRNRSLSFQDFYVRRIKRILPSAVLVLIATVIASQVLFPAIRAKETLVDALYAAVFGANFRFEAIGADYFQRDQPPSPLQHYWSLSIEEQFYFVWPVVIVLIFALTRRFRRKGHTSARQWALFGAMAVVVAASFGWAMFLSANDPNAAYFSTFTRVWELGVGAMLAIAGPWLARIPAVLRPGLGYLGLAGVLGSLFLIDSTVQFPAPWAALPVLSTALVVASFHGSEVRWMFPLTNPVARWFGDTSYTLYLWHWPIIILLLTLVPKGPLLYGIALPCALGLTAVTYRFYEDPIRKSDWLLDKRAARNGRTPTPSVSRWALIGGFMVAVIVVSISQVQYDELLATAHQEAASAAVVKLAPPPPQVGPPAESSSRIVPLTTPLPGANPCYGAPAFLNEVCAWRNSDVPLTPSIETFAIDPGNPNCWTAKGERIRSCTYGYQGSDATRIALVGDSHAARLLDALTPYLDAMKWKLTTYTGLGCSWHHPPQDDCTVAMTDIDQKLLDNRYDLVLSTSYRGSGGKPTDYAAAWAPIAAAGSRIVAVADNPQVTQDDLNCLTRVSFSGDQTGNCVVSKATALSQSDPLIAATDLVPGAQLIDLTQYYCKADRCPLVIGDVIVYQSTTHITSAYMKTLGPAIIDGVRQALSRH